MIGVSVRTGGRPFLWWVYAALLNHAVGGRRHPQPLADSLSSVIACRRACFGAL